MTDQLVEKYEIPVSRYKLRQVYDALDTARSEIEAAVADGLVDDRVLAEIDEAADFMEQLLNV
jgi:hypothetical protein